MTRDKIVGMTVGMTVAPSLPRAVTVHGLAQARAALAPRLPVLLLSGPGAASYGGALWWRNVVEQALDGRHAPDALDCSDEPGRALEALAAGCRIIVLLPCPAFASVADRAGGATMLPRRPVSLDLEQPGNARRLHAWLSAPAAGVTTGGSSS
jgi:hypothetical protein